MFFASFNMLRMVILVTIFFKVLMIDDPLLRMKDHSECIKSVIDASIKKQSCQKLSESEKSNLAIKMTNCLNLKLGKKQIQQCASLKDCKIAGDDWNTFTTFFTHIDNLCHFYWDILHHERTEKLVDDLSDSAILSENILKKNYQSTQKIISMQEMVQIFMQDSLSQNKKLSQTLKNSENKIQNMTSHMEHFLGQLNANLIGQYSSIINVMQTINKGVQGVNTVQAIMMSEISSMSGILYFLFLILIVGILTSFQAFKKSRIHCFSLIAANVLFQIFMPEFILFFAGVKLVRIIFVLFQLGILTRSIFRRDQNFDQMKQYMDCRLETKRIKRIFKEIIEEGRQIGNNPFQEQK